MERTEWLKQMREKAETLYDHFAPLYWVAWGLGADETYLGFLQKFLRRIAPCSTLLSAGCGAGAWDGILLEAGHNVVGIDQSAGMLARAKEHFPEIQYQKMGLQEMDFQEAFDGIICVDALEHVFPEEWPGILQGFRNALKPGGVLYFTVDLAEGEDVPGAYERAKAMGLPVVFGEVVDRTDEAYEQMMTLEAGTVPDGEVADASVYHYHPSLEQVRAWIEQMGLTLEEEGTGGGYEHFVVRKSKARNTDSKTPRTIDEYIAGFPPDVQQILEDIRRTIKQAAPEATETISYQMPTFTLKGNLVHFAAFKKHIGFYPAPTGIEAFKDELSVYEGGKGSVQFPLDRPIPFDLIRRIVEFRVKENLERAVAKGKKSS